MGSSKPVWLNLQSKRIEYTSLLYPSRRTLSSLLKLNIYGDDSCDRLATSPARRPCDGGKTRIFIRNLTPSHSRQQPLIPARYLPFLCDVVNAVLKYAVPVGAISESRPHSPTQSRNKENVSKFRTLTCGVKYLAKTKAHVYPPDFLDIGQS